MFVRTEALDRPPCERAGLAAALELRQRELEPADVERTPRAARLWRAMQTDERAFDLVVIGSGPAGQKGAIAAAKLGKRVALVDRKEWVGGVCLHTGTIPSKTLREAILYFTGFRERSFYGREFALKREVTVADLAFRVQTVLARETEVVNAQLARNGVELVAGEARFIDPHRIAVSASDGTVRELAAERVLIACGTRPAHVSEIPCDGARVFDSDQLLSFERIPRELIVVGGGVIGLEYASMFAALGVRVCLVEQRELLLDFADREVVDALCRDLTANGAVFRLGAKVVRIDTDANGVTAELDVGERVRADALLYAIGRQANADRLNVAAAGIACDARGRIAVDAEYRTEVAHIAAAGDVIGFPALASTSMEQGRIAVHHMFGENAEHRPEIIPYGIYTIPEISMVGRNEAQLVQSGVDYAVGRARFVELAKGQMVGVEEGFLKLLFERASLKLLGVHAFGELATELVHIGQAVLAFGGSLEYFRDTVFNYPTFAEAYKVAALDGFNALHRR